MTPQELAAIERMYKKMDQEQGRTVLTGERKQGIRLQSQFNYEVKKIEIKQQEEEETERLIQGLKDIGFKGY